MNRLHKLLDLRRRNDIHLHVQKKEKRETRIEREKSGCNVADFDHFESEILVEWKRVKKDLEDMVYRMELTYDEIVDILDINYTDGSTFGCVLPVGIYKVTDKNSLINSLLPDGVKVKITVDDIKLRTNLTTEKTINFAKKCFLYTI